MSYSDHKDAAEAKAHLYVREVLGLYPLGELPDDFRARNDYDALLKAFRAGVYWALDELPHEAEDDRRV